jgi:hypothetical protein
VMSHLPLGGRRVAPVRLVGAIGYSLSEYTQRQTCSEMPGVAVGTWGWGTALLLRRPQCGRAGAESCSLA